ncbi:MAG: hypothetical protein K2G41_05785 [Duncaniella sp.]|uniref:hypothetical protein n=1 Tax=Duncaniella sp. TaxID=2518496 RepID=UPI0023C4E476|nr:hypothetical protein [Duncaniella sp.]MDE6090194.1 hypothetical protein [Duncaniella sp.]
MKRIFYLLLMLPLLGFMASCDDDKDLPQVTLSVDYTGGSEVDGVIQVTQGDTLNITALRAVPVEGTKAATLGVVEYFFDGIPQGRTAISPYPISINTTDLELGKHYLGVNATVLQVDKEVGFAVAQFTINVVANENPDQPGEGGDQGGTINPETRITDNAN